MKIANFEDDLIRPLAIAIASRCINCQDVDLEEIKKQFDDEQLVDSSKTGPTKAKWYQKNHYKQGLEPRNHSSNEDWPYDMGLTQQIFFGTSYGPKRGYNVYTYFNRIGIKDLTIMPIDVGNVYSMLIQMLFENMLGGIIPLKTNITSDSVKHNIISVGNLYYFARVVSEFIYRNIRLIVCPDKHVYYYILDPIDIGNYNIPFGIDTLDFKEMSNEKKESYLTDFFDAIAKAGNGLFVKRKDTCNYKLRVNYKYD